MEPSNKSGDCGTIEMTERTERCHQKRSWNEKKRFTIVKPNSFDIHIIYNDRAVGGLYDTEQRQKKL
jgi:hypothetical protein